MIIISVLKTFYTMINKVCKIIARFLVYFGLYIPFIYMLIMGLLMIFGKLNLAESNYQTSLFYLGLVVCLVSSVVITYQNITRGKQMRKRNNPYYNYPYNTNIPYYGPAMQGYFPQPPTSAPRSQLKKSRRGGYNPYNAGTYYPSNYAPPINNYYTEKPMIFRHPKYQGVIVYQYSDRYEYYGDNGRQLVYMKTQYKR